MSFINRYIFFYFIIFISFVLFLGSSNKRKSVSFRYICAILHNKLFLFKFLINKTSFQKPQSGRVAKTLVFLFSRIRPGFQVGYPMKVLVIVTFRFQLFRFGEKHTMKNYHFEEGKLTQNQISFQRVQDRIDCSNFLRHRN